MSGSFAGKVALVTGGASGIGRATVEQLAAAGARVVVADLDDVQGAGVADAVHASGGEAVFVRTDVAVPDEVEAMVAATLDRFERLDVAVNNAGRPGAYAALTDQTLEDWERTLAVNLTGTFMCLRAEISAMVTAGGGAIVNVASAAGLMGFAHLPAYVASKHGVIGLTKSVALEFARSGIRVNAVCPGNVRTQMLEGFAGGDEQTLQGMGRMQPIGRLGTPQEVAEAIVWLCSDAASFVTGHAMAVDGGVLAT
ncbi:glucose 1-dehydrogenase [Rhabdothermincola sediminis]|uniref:glucose 1-dehydrogenase n=1 Tax=Rhabdothermincola sediminis TaxID=2751370 RepID=UPI001AA0824C|nr:glucose 1-dehydrogenase [Rhabdothermincola sediminis]